MASSMRCRLAGCDLDACGVCRRCGDARQAKHSWKEAERTRPCFQRTVCERCQAERERPDHDWEMGQPGAATGEVSMECKRCGLSI